MQEFYKERRQQYLRQMMKYLKYVFNDHLMILLFFLLGGGIYAYANFLKTTVLWPKLLSKSIVILLVLASIFIGKLVTLFVEADKIFLLPRAGQLKPYLKQAIKVSSWLPVFMISGVLLAVWPFAIKMQAYSKSELVLILIVALSLKFIQLTIAASDCYQGNKKSKQFNLLIAICMLLFLSPFGDYLAIAMVIALAFYTWRIVQVKATRLLDFGHAIALEEQRLQVVYKWINLFTDVPGIATMVHRRKYLDFIQKRIKVKQQNTFTYLYVSHLLRGSTFGPLVVRLVIISNLLLFFTKNFWVDMVICNLFLFLVLLQLLPMYSTFDYILWTNLYPVSQKVKVTNFRKVLFYLSLFMIFLNFIVMLMTLSVLGGIIIICLEVILVSVMLYLYLPSFIKRNS